MGTNWIWDLHPLVPGAWGNVQYDSEYWGDWPCEAGSIVTLRRWVTGPNGPAFLTEYTPADDYIADDTIGDAPGTIHRPGTYNGLCRDGDWDFYVPLPEDLARVKGVFPNLSDPADPSWAQVEAELVAAGRSMEELRSMTATTLVRLLAKVRSADDAAAWNDLQHEKGDAERPSATRGSDDDLPESVKDARDQYLAACEALGNDRPTDREAYEVLERFNAEAHSSKRAEPYTLPPFDTWARYLREWRKATGQSKASSRHARLGTIAAGEGRSVVRAQDVRD